MGCEIINSTRRLWADHMRRTLQHPTVVRMDQETHAKLCAEIEDMNLGLDVRAPVTGMTHILGMRVEVVDAPEWLEVR